MLTLLLNKTFNSAVTLTFDLLTPDIHSLFYFMVEKENQPTKIGLYSCQAGTVSTVIMLVNGIGIGVWNQMSKVKVKRQGHWVVKVLHFDNVQCPNSTLLPPIFVLYTAYVCFSLG